MPVNLKKKCFQTMQRYAVFFVQQLREKTFAIRQQEKPSQQRLKRKISRLVFKLFLGKGFALLKYSPVTVHYPLATAILNGTPDQRGGRDEVWDQEMMFSQLAKRSPSMVVSGYLQYFSHSKYFQKQEANWQRKSEIMLKKLKKVISFIFVFLAHCICLSVLKCGGN